jgi:CubicO group peptidase (beta-lactamase class C family)
MNILTHALAKVYGLYDVNDPEGSPGFQALLEEKIGAPLGARWEYSLTNFKHPPEARLGVFGYYCQVHTTALDLARAGWLWRCRGRRGDRQLVPQRWMEESTRTNADLLAHGKEEELKYGHGFWVNDRGKLWPDLPRDGFTASGAGGHYASVFPSLDLVVVQNPGPCRSTPSGEPARANPELLALVLDALVD